MLLLTGEKRDENAIATALAEKSQAECFRETVSTEPEIKSALSAVDVPSEPDLPRMLITDAEAIPS
jgi:hypothetical protein